MLKPEPSKLKSGFVIKLSNETLQKLQDDSVITSALKDKPPSMQTPGSHIVSSNPANEGGESALAVQKSQSPSSVQVLNKDDDVNMKKNPNKKETDKDEQSGSAKEAEVNPSSSYDAYAPYITYEGEVAIYTDPATKLNYIWCDKTKSWTQKDPEQKPEENAGRVYSYENDTHVYTESDGTKFFWDTEKKAWIPKVDDEFLALYQMSYGFVDNTRKEPEIKQPQPVKKSDLPPQKRKVEPAQWFEASEDNNTKVYVSNLPLDLTEEEFVNLMQKCGLVMRDPNTQKMKVKLYMDKEQNCFKGDALCTYIKIESVDLALNLLDGYDYRGQKLGVQKATFQLKGDYNPALKPKKKKKKELEKLKRMQEKLFDWRPEKAIGERAKHEKVVIVKNLFDPSDFDKDVQLILDYQQDLREECSKSGTVKKVVVYDRHPEGVAQINMKEPEEADAVIKLINGRWFGKRKITAEIWDGKTKFKIAETDADINKRVGKWEKFLEGENTETANAKKCIDTNETDATLLKINVSDNISAGDLSTCVDSKETLVTNINEGKPESIHIDKCDEPETNTSLDTN